MVVVVGEVAVVVVVIDSSATTTIRISRSVTFTAMCNIRCERPVVREGHRSTWWKPPPNTKSLATFSHAHVGLP